MSCSLHTDGVDLQRDMWAQDLVPLEDTKYCRSVVMDSAEGMGKRRIRGEESFEYSLLRMRGSCGEAVNDIVNVDNWIVHGRWAELCWRIIG